MITVTLFGDSICNGYGVSLCDIWSVKLSKHLQLTYNNKVRLMNSSVDGRTTRQALLDMPYHIQSHPPDVLIVQFGMNDCNYWVTDKGIPRVSPASFKANLQEIVNRAYAFNVTSVILNTNHPTCLSDKINSGTSWMNRVDDNYQESNERYNMAIRQVANLDNYIILNDIEKMFLKCSRKGSELVLPDKLHPSIYGHDLYFDTTQQKLEEVINEII